LFCLDAKLDMLDLAMPRRVQCTCGGEVFRMKRRAFTALLGGAVLSSSLLARAGRAQQTLPVIGFLSSGSPTRDDSIFAAFHRGLASTGLEVGRNVNLEFRIGPHDQFMEHAQELVRRKVAVIVLAGRTPPAVLAASAATSSVPIVFASTIDPVEAGAVTSLSRPGGSITGVATLNVELAAKRLELLRELLPHAATIALMVNPENAPMTRAYAGRTEEAAAALRLLTEAYTQLGIYTGRILKGEKPADLPVMQTTTIELVFNLKTAKSLGLDVPARFLVRADEVIE
jgi:ABC-type uncharacterized transport system substrate-binding protein